MKAVVLWFAILSLALADDAPRGTLTGRVTDPSGAAVSGAAVTVTNPATSEASRAFADVQGRFNLSLATGVYDVMIEAPGFTTFRREAVNVGAGRPATVDALLEIGALAEQVTVSAKAADLVEALEVRQVRESSARDVGEALASVDGVWKIRKGGIANDILIRGFQQGNINVVIDGARIYGACPSHMDPPAYHVDFSEIQQVEITKGAFDLRNQGSLGGTVEIINRTPTGGFHVTPTVSTGSFGFVNPSMTVSISNEKVWALGGASYRRSDPYRDGSGKRFTEYANFRADTKNSDAFDIKTGWFRFGATPGANQHLELNYTRQAGGLVLYPYLMMDAGYDNADRLNATYHIGELDGPFKQVRIQSYFTQVKHWMTDELRASSVGLMRPYSMATYAGTKVLGARVETEIAGVTTGFEGYRRNWIGVNTMRMGGMYMDQTAIPNVDTSVGGLYALFQRTWRSKLTLNAGARVDLARSEARSANVNTDLYWAYQGTRSLSHNDVDPSASARIAYSLPKGFQIFAGAGRTVRIPDPSERYIAFKRSGSDWVGDPNLRPTRNTETDLGVNYRNGRVAVRTTFFYSRLSDFITLHDQLRLNMVAGIMNTAARSFTNVNGRMYGGEMAYNVRLSRTLITSGSLSYTRGTKDLDPAAMIRSKNIAELPPLKSTASLRWGTRIFFAEVQGMASNAQNNVDADVRELRTPGYAVMNLRGGVHTSKLNVAAGMDNVFNRFYYEHCSYQRDPFRTGAKVPEPGRALSMTVSYAF